MNPNDAVGWLLSTWIQLYLGEHQTALDHNSRYVHLSPRDPNMFQGKLQSALAHLFLGHYEEAAHLAEQIVGERPAFLPGWTTLAASSALAGDAASASIAKTKVLELGPRPPRTASLMASNLPLRRAVDFERLKEGYIRAGFPP